MPDAESEKPLSARAHRFSRSLQGEPAPHFADLQRATRIDCLAGTHRAKIAALVALLDARRAIDAELNGSRLGALATIVGADMFDKVCDARISPSIYRRGAAVLPQPALLVKRGEELLRCHARSADILPLAEIAAEILANTPAREIAA